SARQPLRVLLDSRLSLPASARLLEPPGDVRIYTRASPAHIAARAGEFDAQRVRVVALPAADPDDGRIALEPVLADLARQGINELHVEAGQTLNGAFLGAGLVDELLLYLAPTLLGQGRGLAALDVPASLDEAPRFDFHRVDPIGDDLRLLARPRGRQAGWWPVQAPAARP
ncbi:MAG TPA: dihydrofolate reductase family protein, partial [Burkholderiaceae bacterium]|nr:dihydrofolate reductase family protein [Burkholderiaceae bacterium]